MITKAGDEWLLIETAPKSGEFIWLSDGFLMRIGYWYVVTTDEAMEHYGFFERPANARGGQPRSHRAN